MPRLPGSEKVLMDVMEWYAHSIFLEDSTVSDILFGSEQLQRLTSLAYHHQPPAGRIWNRLLLSMLVQNVCTRHTLEGAASLYHMKEAEWTNVLHNLSTCRTELLKSNANTFPPEGHDRPDEDLMELPMFQEVYKEVHELVQCHVVLSKFRQKLDASHGDDVSQLLHDFTKALPKTFHEHFVPYLAKDVLSSPKKHTNVARKLSSDLEYLLLKQEDKPYSYNTLQRKCKTLCRTWNESLLGIPTLARIGYGGMRLSRFQEDEQGDDTKTVSSWGMDDEEEEDDEATRKYDEVSSSDYHTADEEDDAVRPTHKGSSSHHHISVQPLEIRPRESWKEDFNMIDGLQQLRTEDGMEQNESKRSHVRHVTDDPIIQGARERRRRRRLKRTSSSTPSAASSNPKQPAVHNNKKRKYNNNNNHYDSSSSSTTTESEDAPDALDRLPTYAQTKKKQRRMQQQQQQSNDDDDSSDDALDRLPTYAETRRRQQPASRLARSTAFTTQQIKILQEGVETHGDNAWDIIISESGSILGDKKPWQCRAYYQEQMME